MIKPIHQTEFGIFFTLSSIAFIVFYFRIRNKNFPIIREFYILGTVIQLKVYGKNGHRAIEEAINRLSDIDNKMSIFKKYSEISMINQNAGSSSQKVSKDAYFVMKESVKYSKLSEGCFDPTIGPVVELWNIGTDKARIPSDNEIRSKLKLVNYKDIILNEKDRSIKLKKANQTINVGGIAKGYAADEVKNVFKKIILKVL